MADKKEEKKNKIVEAALEVIHERGYCNTKVEEITERANVGYGTFYQYFRSKKDLLSMLAEEMCDHIGDYFYSKNSKKLTIGERLYLGASEIINFFIENRIVFLAVHEARVSDSSFSHYETQIFDSLYNRLKYDIDYFRKKNLCREDVDEDVIFVVTCMVNRYIKNIMQSDKKNIDIEERTHILSQAVYNILFNDNSLHTPIDDTAVIQ